MNVTQSRLEIAENQDDIAKAFEGVSKDLGYKVKLIYTDPSNSPQLIGVDKNGNPYIKDGTAYVDKKTGIGYILINTESPANRTKAGVIGTIAEEQSHIIGKIEGRQKEVPDGSEKGLESLGRPTNDYFKDKYSKNDKAIGLKSDGRDYSNVDFGENVGNHPGYLILLKQEEKVRETLEKNKGDISNSEFHKELIRLARVGGQGIIKSKYEGIYVLRDKKTRKKILNEDGTLHLDEFDPENWKKVENSEIFKEKVEELRKDAQEYYKKWSRKKTKQNCGFCRHNRWFYYNWFRICFR